MVDMRKTSEVRFLGSMSTMSTLFLICTGSGDIGVGEVTLDATELLLDPVPVVLGLSP